MLKELPSDKLKVTQICSFFSRAPTHHNFTFNFDELKHKVHLFKIVCRVFYFRFRFVFIKVYIFVQQKTWTLS